MNNGYWTECQGRWVEVSFPLGHYAHWNQLCCPELSTAAFFSMQIPDETSHHNKEAETLWSTPPNRYLFWMSVAPLSFSCFTTLLSPQHKILWNPICFFPLERHIQVSWTLVCLVPWHMQALSTASMKRFSSSVCLVSIATIVMITNAMTW